MQPLSEFSYSAASAVRGVFADIDDTITSDGLLTAEAYTALQSLHDAGLSVVPVTGRPAGWCDHIARMWPVSAVVGENGAFYFHYDRDARKMSKRFLQGEAVRTAGRERLQLLAAEILHQVPGAALASDQAWRECDLAIDFCEDVTPLGDAAVDRIVELFIAAGAQAKVSSIHVNGWFGDYDKLGMTAILARERFGVELAEAREEFVYIGDSPNDAPMFEYFPNSVGVANVHAFGNRIETLPRYVTRGRSGAGFCELARHLLAARTR
jgi:HAD superfamily hydrolase (TIGR01484 family)